MKSSRVVNLIQWKSFSKSLTKLPHKSCELGSSEDQKGQSFLYELCPNKTNILSWKKLSRINCLSMVSSKW